MKINSSQLEAFYYTAKHLHFTKAANDLNVTQSALSQRIAKLEEELGVSLFIRDRSSIRLTAAGERMLRYSQLNESIELELLSQLKDSQEGLAGVLKLGGFSSINRSIVIPSLKKIMTNNPKLSLSVCTVEIRELSSLLQSSAVDYIFTSKNTGSPDVESILLGFEKNVLVKLKSAPNNEIYLDHDESDPTTKSYFNKNIINQKPQLMRYLDDVYGLIDGVKNGFGKAVLPLHLIHGQKDFEIINPKNQLKVPIYLQFYKYPYYKKVHNQFIEDVKLGFKNALG